MDYSMILTRSFQMIWKNRALWVFGILLALFGGGGGSLPSGFPGGSIGNGVPSGGNTFPGPTPQVPSSDWNAIVPIIAAVVCVILILAVVGVALRLISRGALIGLVNELEVKQSIPTVRRGFRIGWNRFGSLLGIAILINLPLVLLALILLALVALPFLGALSASGNVQFDQILAMGGMSSVLFLICAIFCLAGLGFLLKPIYEFIVRACVISDLGAMNSIREGWRVVRANLGGVVVLYLLQIAVGIGFGILMIPVTIVLIAIPAVIGAVLFFAANASPIAIIVGIIVGIPVLLILLWISGLYRAFESTLWTEGYLQAAKSEQSVRQIANA